MRHPYSVSLPDDGIMKKRNMLCRKYIVVNSTSYIYFVSSSRFIHLTGTRLSPKYINYLKNFVLSKIVFMEPVRLTVLTASLPLYRGYCSYSIRTLFIWGFIIIYSTVRIYIMCLLIVYFVTVRNTIFILLLLCLLPGKPSLRVPLLQSVHLLLISRCWP